jgi:diguanylate cyclase (GGDEF)-like protein
MSGRDAHLNDLLRELIDPNTVNQPVPVLSKVADYLGMDGGFIYLQNRMTGRDYYNVTKFVNKPGINLPDSISICFVPDAPNDMDKLASYVNSCLKEFLHIKELRAFPIVVDGRSVVGFVGLFLHKVQMQFSFKEEFLLNTALALVMNKIKQEYLQQLRYNARASLEKAIDNTGVDIYVTDYYTNELLYVNKSLAEPYGGADEILGQTCFLTFYEDKVEECEYCPKRFRDDANAFSEEIRIWEYQRPRDGQWIRAFSAVFEWEEALMAHVVTSIDITELKQKEKIITELALFDTLTRISNRRSFENDFDKAMEKVKEEGSVGHLFFVDLDNFKHINDAFGHEQGDELLIQVASFLAEFDDVHRHAYRFGGDEFLILTTALPFEEIKAFCNQLVARFAKPWILKGDEFFCTASIGVSTFPRDGDTRDKLLAAADLAMYKVKKSGKASVMFSDGKETAETGAMGFEFALHKAVNDGCKEFSLLYHPIVEVKTGNWIGAEVLVRWKSPQYGVVLPEVFIPVAESSGNIETLEKWIVSTAAAAASEWKIPAKPFIVGINVSHLELCSDGFADFIIPLAKNCDKQGFKFLLETAGNESFNYDESVANRLRNNNIMLALDAFGAGYSSISIIQELKVDMVKIDRDLVITFLENNLKKTIALALVMIAHAAGTKICAEGVSSHEHLSILAGAGCDYAQGTYYIEPIGAEDFKKALIKGTV